MKNLVLLFSIGGLALMWVSRNSVTFNICNQIDYSCRTTLDKIENICFFFPFLFVFSVITYLMPARVFKSWWKFARVATPLILLGSWVISLGLHHSPGGFFNMDNNFDLLGLMIMYVIFVVGSLIQIWRGYQSR
jgi:hypothetical protein